MLRRVLREKRILKRIADDLAMLFDATGETEINRMDAGELWDGNEGSVQGGVNYGEDQ